jgi:arylsulfatase
MSTRRPPNILWYCTDQQRWDTIGALTQPQISTPQVDALAASGTAFLRAYTQSPICTPARACFLTGRYPASHHVYRNGNAYFPPSEKLVTKLFAEAGYDCGLVGKLHLSGASKRYEPRPDDGYRAYYWSHHPTPDAARGHDYETWLRHEKKVDPIELFSHVNYFCGPGVPAALHQTTWCSDMAIRFVTERRDGPWLLSVNTFDPHAPFDAPPEYLAKIDPGKLDLPLFREHDLERQKAFADIDQQTIVAQDPRVRRQVKPVSAGDHDSIASSPNDYDALEVKANYYAMIMLIDDQLRRIVDTLRETGQLDNTIIVYMSDHGELLGDHGLILKGCRFFDGLVRVPLIISWPEGFRSGIVSNALVETLDLAPTLLDAAGLPVPEFMQGKSLVPILEGKTDPARHKPHVISEYYDAVGGHPDHTHATMVFDGRWKSIVYHGHQVGELYDLGNDPGEFDNLWDDPAARDVKAERIRYHLDAMMQTISVGPPRIANY